MANSVNGSLVVEKLDEEKAARDSDSGSDSESYPDSESSIGESSQKDCWHGHLLFHWILAKWNKIFVASCLFAVLLDPLFLYIPVINEDRNCLRLDQNLKITAVTLRSVTDIFYIMDIIIQVYRSEISSSLTPFYYISNIQLWHTLFPTLTKTIWKSYVLIDILAILPLPQVLILNFFPKMWGYGSLSTSFLVTVQYIPRVLRIYLLCKGSRKSSNNSKGETPLWVKGVLNFFMYILASHVLGAIWYFFAIQRLTVCWQHACRNENGCASITFGCQYATFRNDTSLNGSCPISSPDPAIFDFGIFLSVLQSGVPWSTNFLKKFLNCFCWGLRNLSAFGSNLQPSANTWENLFVVFISIIGLLLFIYLIGNLQTYLSLDTARIEAHRHKLKMKRKMVEKGREVELWLPKNGIPEKMSKEIKSEMMEMVEQEFEEGREVVLDNFVSVLPRDLGNKIKSFMPMTKLRKVRLLQNMEHQVLKEICRHLKPTKYTKNTVIIREDEPLKMILIVEGDVSITKKGGFVLQQSAGDLCGKKLIEWPFEPTFPKQSPLATEAATAIGDVEALILTDSDMKTVASAFRVHFIKKFDDLKQNLIKHARPVDTTQTTATTSPGTMLKIFTQKELKKATNNYHDSIVLGEGGYGVVYKGVLPDGTVVAIKKSKGGGQLFESETFVNEALLLSEIRHKNVVKLLGCCLETKMPIMVYEFISNGNLYEHIHHGGEGGQRHLGLPLESRLTIAAETAGALAYLHSMSIIHRDVKTSNILLDERFTAKLSDFGASRLLYEDEYEHEVTTRVQGTAGYLDPEYFLTSKLTEKSDVYSFGVVLMELLTSRHPVSWKETAEVRSLARLFVLSVEEGHLDQIVDGEIVKEGSFETIEQVSHLAMRCVKLRGDERPSMKEVAMELEGLTRIIAKHEGEEARFFPSPDDTDYLFGSPSNAYVVDVRGEGDL